MVTFDAREAGTTESTWTADDRLARLPTLDLSGIDTVVVLAAHPDDETLGAGGLLAEARSRGIHCTVVVVTDGARSHPDSPTTPATALADLRSREVRAALADLDSDIPLVQLGYPDGQVRELRDAIERDIDLVLDDLPGTAALVSTWRGDGHRDHRVLGEIAASIATERGLRLLEYPIWLWHWGTPDSVPWHDLLGLPLSPEARDAKITAIAQHESQTSRLSSAAQDGPLLRPDFVEHFERDFEVFVEQGRQRAHFDRVHNRRQDPWLFETRWYEKRKRAITLASLPAQRYATALEIGCSIGVLTQQLAEVCDSLLAVDLSSVAVERARTRLASAPSVEIRQADVALDFPDGPFDLIVFSEVGYYFDAASLESVLDQIEAQLTPDGTLVACHWRAPLPDAALTASDVHSAIERRSGLTRLLRHEEKDFVLDIVARDPRSVAERTGLL